MIYTLTALAIILLVVCFVLSKTLAPLLRVARRNRRLLRDGTEADAVLLNVEQTGLYVNKQPQVKLQLQVHPLIGRNFVSEAREVISLIDLGRLRIGSSLKVKYNPANTKEITVLRNAVSAALF